jgi:predicted flap endonuclease-1-like 5' DNA nuclease
MEGVAAAVPRHGEPLCMFRPRPMYCKRVAAGTTLAGADIVEHRQVERPMWDQTFKRWIDLVFWWLPKHETAPPPAPRTAQPGAEHAPKQAAPQASEPVPGGTAQQAARAKEPAATPTAKHAAAEQAPKQRAPDDLTVIKGIGPVVQQKLQALGIRTFDDLAAADPETLAEQLKGRQPISRGQVRSWTRAADQQSAARH